MFVNHCIQHLLSFYEFRATPCTTLHVIKLLMQYLLLLKKKLHMQRLLSLHKTPHATPAIVNKTPHAIPAIAA